VASPAALKALLDALEAEQDKRARLRGEEVGADPRERLYRKLDEMAARIRAAPDYVKPGAAERAEITRELDRWLAERFGNGDPK
jgi:hypothetical protein